MSSKKGKGFESFGLISSIYKAVKFKGFNFPTPIQKKAIPLIIQGKDIVACSKTGSGKTAAFIIPTLNKLQAHSQIYGARCLIICPTRELALQTAQVLKIFTKFSDIKYSLIVGGHEYEGQFESLASNPDIIVSTPGRLMQLLKETDLSLKRVEVLIFDEADYLLEMGFAEQMKEILKYVNPNRQTLLFSATIPKQLQDFAKSGLQEYVFVKLSAEYELADTLKLNFFLCREQERISTLIYILENCLKSDEQTIIFSSSRYQVDFLESILNKLSFKTIGLYGKMDQFVRKDQMQAFQKKEFSILIVTDLAARGLDMPSVQNVIHYDYPAKPKIFIHRSGRTGRNQAFGQVFAIFSYLETMYITEISIFVGKKISNEIKDLEDKDKISYGALETQHVMDYQGKITEILKDDLEIKKFYNSSLKALQKFHKTRSSASKSSVRESYNIDFKVLNPFVKLKENIDDNDDIKKLQFFKPNQSFLLWKKSKNPNSQESKAFQEYSEKFRLQEKQKKQRLERKKEFENQQSSLYNSSKIKIGSSKYQDPKFYIPIKPNPKGCSLFDEDEKQITTQDIGSFYVQDDENITKGKFIWDKKKKNFIKDPGNRQKPQKQQENKAKDSYGKWKKRKNLHLQKVGEEEDKRIVEQAKNRFKERRFHLKGPQQKVKNSKNELKNFDQIVKGRKQKMKKQSTKVSSKSKKVKRK